MTALADAAAGELLAQVAVRWRAADPLLPGPAAGPSGEPAARPDGCGQPFIVTRPDGALTAAGTCEHWEGTPGSLDLAWGAARQFRLRARVAGPDVSGGLDALLAQWREHLASVPGTDDTDSAAMVMWPSRDVTGVAALRRRGLIPSEVIAARLPGARPAIQVPAGDAVDGVTIRRAAPADLDAALRLGLEVVRYDSLVCSVTERPDTAAALRREIQAGLSVPEPWIWLAERDGEAVGMLSAERPEQAGWIAPMAGVSPVSYLLLLGVSQGVRGGGIGARLAARFHQEAQAAGVGLLLLHYAQVNPLSMPFWSQQGYRPLWTGWEARPARAIR
jgi:GNAT superfamily N-acetyltransferase